MVITIDGPAGSGKSTAARNLAAALGFDFLDTGAMYRAVTCRAMRHGVNLADPEAMADHARQIELQLIPHPTGLQVLMDGEDITELIRTEAVSRNAHFAARPPQVREVLVELQRKAGRDFGSFVTEGRDQGTVVFPNADVKFYLDADPEERARRRCDELRQRGEPVDYDDVLDSIHRRDRSDKCRAVGPLRIPKGAIVVDTTNTSQQETVDLLLRHVEDRR
jgi:CMP/dCMP kinase